MKSSKSILEIHDQIHESIGFNFMNSQLNADVWDKYLHNYWDQQLAYLICYGFPLDFDHNVSLVNNKSNHKSAIDFKEDIEVYLKEEKVLGQF